MTNVNVPQELAADPDMPSRAVKVYLALAAAGWLPALPVRDVARLSGLSLPTTYRALEDLEKAGWITRMRTPKKREADTELVR